jgi:hydrogenase nickel incorporation protein HypB
MCENCGCSITDGKALDALDARLRHRQGDVHAPEHVDLREGASAEPVAAESITAESITAESITVLRNLLSANDRIAAHNHEHFDAHAVLAVNLMSAPGAGKTSLLERTIGALCGELRIAVIEGDLATENDARRIRARGVPAVQITTGRACHLDARMVHEALHELDLDGVDLLFIENVGNLVCPASFGLGQHRDVILLSVPEGDDKPEKYPVMFRGGDLVLLSKSDLLPVLPEFDPQRAEESLRSLGNGAPLLRVSSRDGSGLQEWCRWLVEQLRTQRQHLAHERVTARLGV